ncbi:MAG: Pyridoxamine 5-phosphate oxidase [Symbiobacteriaceae bacterium]|jgi:hypothetical protein|nr:Pyridoxamine 5-phosphate oxidase [Symbiobacteriaceae bacterium]
MGDHLPQELLQKLHHGNLYRPGGLGLAVLTLDPAGWPHLAMAPGCVAVAPHQVWVALGGSSQSLANVQRNGIATLQIAGPGTLYYVKGRAAVVRPEMQVMQQEAALRLDVNEVLADTESFVEITSGIGYRYRLMHEDFVQIIGALLDELHTLATEAR